MMKMVGGIKGKALAVTLAVVMLMQGAGTVAFAQGSPPPESCTHTHDEACGYAEGADCTHAHDEDCGGLPPAQTDGNEGGEEATTNTITAFEPLADEVLWQGYDYGTVETQADLNLPATLDATGLDEAPLTLTDVAWACTAAETMAGDVLEPAFDPAVSASYTFAPVLPQGYVLAEGAAAPEISVFIRPQGGVQAAPMMDTDTVTDFAGLKARIDTFNTSASDDLTITVSGSITVTEVLEVTNTTYTLTLTGGTLNRGGEGFYLLDVNGGKLVLQSITLDGQKATYTTNGYSLAYVFGGGTLTLEDGAVLQNNRSSGRGGGIYIGNGILVMNDGASICGNTDSNSGGGVDLHFGIFTMNGGTISGNTGSIGGGVRVHAGATFTMSGGEISGNETPWGGGVYVFGTMTMSGDALITDNTATSDLLGRGGGGVCVSSGAILTMNGGKITGNHATGTFGAGGGGTFIR